MALSISAYLTTAGLQVINKLLATQGPLYFTRAQLGKGVATSEEQARALTALISPVTNASLTGVVYQGGQAVITVQYDNRGLQTGFFVNEIGLFVRDPDNQAKEILYCYATFSGTPDWISPQAEALYVRTYRISTIVSNLQNVTVNITPGAMVSQEDFDAAVKLTRDISDAGISALHQYVRARIGNTELSMTEIEQDLLGKISQEQLNLALQQVNASIAQTHQFADNGMQAINLSIEAIEGILDDHRIEFTPEIIDVTLTNSLSFPFNNSKFTVALATARMSKNYEIDIEIVTGSLNIGDIVVSDKLLNGFKVEFTGSAASVQLRFIIKGGMIT